MINSLLFTDHLYGMVLMILGNQYLQVSIYSLYRPGN